MLDCRQLIFGWPVSILDVSAPRQPRLLATLAVGLYPHGVFASIDGSQVRVTDSMQRTVALIDTRTRVVTRV